MDLHRRVADDIERLIDLGEFPVGDRLPGQDRLARRFEVSTTTIRLALDELLARNRVRVRRRSGVYALDKPARRVRMALSMVVRRNPLGYLFNRHSGRWPALAVPTRTTVTCPPEVAELLGLDEGDQVLARRRVVGPQPGEPMQITTTYLPLPIVEQAPQLREADTGPGGYLEIIEHALGLGPVRWPAEVYPRLPTAEEAADLDMPEQQPVFVEARVVVDPRTDRPVAVDVAVRDGRRWALTYEIERDASAAWPTTPATERNVVAASTDTPKPGSDTPVPVSSGPKG